MKEDCLVLHLPDVEEWICQVKEEPTRTTIEGKRAREGWTRMPPVSIRGRKRRPRGRLPTSCDKCKSKPTSLYKKKFSRN